MIQRRVFAGGWFAECQPDGAYATLIRGSHLETSRGRVERPSGQNVLDLRLAPDGRIAGVGNDGPVKDRALLWSPTYPVWVDQGAAWGRNAVAFNAHGALVVRHGPPPSGYRYVEDGTGRLVTAEETYADPMRRLWEYTIHGDVTVGQGGDQLGLGDDPCLVLWHGTRYLLQDGRCRFIRFNRSGDRLAVAFVREDRDEAVCVWLTVTEIASLPEVGLPAPKPSPPPSPTPSPEPPTVPYTPHRLPAPVEATVRAYAARYPLPHTEDAQREWMRGLVEQVVFRHGSGYGWKRADPGRPLSLDCLATREPFEGWDVVRAAGSDQAVLTADNLSIDLTGQTFVPVSGVDHLGAGQPSTPPQTEPQPPEPQPPSAPPTVPASELTEVKAVLLAVTQQLQTMEGAAAMRHADLLEAAGEIEALVKASRKVTIRAGWLGTLSGEMEAIK